MKTHRRECLNSCVDDENSTINNVIRGQREDYKKEGRKQQRDDNVRLPAGPVAFIEKETRACIPST